jgi:hypothetical protein
VKNTEELAIAAENAGYDGVIVRNVLDVGTFGDYNEPADVYIIFKATQIKSATANVGTYDPNDPDIRHNPRRPARRKAR